MLFGTLSWSVLPLAIELSKAGGSPLIFFTVLGISGAIGLTIYVAIFHNSYFNFSEFKKFISGLRGNTISNSSNIFVKIWEKHVFIFAQIGRFGLLLYAWSTRYLDTAIAAMLYEAWVIWFILLRSADKQIEEKNKILKYGYQSYILLGFALIGFGFVQYSQTGEVLFVINWGIILGIFGSFLEALKVERPLKFGENIAKDDNAIAGKIANNSKSDQTKLVHTIFLNAITAVIGSIISGIIVLFQGFVSETGFSNYILQELQGMHWVALYGLFLGSASIICIRKANIVTDSLEVNSITNLAPISTLLLLVFFTDINLSRPDTFILGAMIIIISNTLLNTQKTEKKFGATKWIILSIWCSGVIVFYRDSIMSNILNDNWLWNGKTDYFALLGLSSTFFILILSFKLQKLSEVKRVEEENAYSLLWQFKTLKDANSFELEKIAKIIGSKNKYSVDDANFIHSSIEDLPNMTHLDRAHAHSKLDILLNNKTAHRKRSIETVVLWIFAMLNIFISLASRPYFAQWNGLIIDFFDIIFSATIIYLIINLFEETSERAYNFNKDIIYSDIWVSIVMPILLCSSLVIVLFWLLYGKWIGDWVWLSNVQPTLRS